ncbi:MAG: RimK family alpha-L-glutamate ligase [Ardenticatenaceae bacterium]|nr:RimK family alpha-L-glutamate ligase [Anaerolineales bacterium]MCB8920740.1 RimK family alpha-L-glutamate ligase [Ardenticatenaceae bacterium]MCB8989699.1 RimK family alpha-L-glutamate ligase [Ardenticatenaceae bacterium]MCB9002842.1 RimK family alpha-L-glutamate ligase [Ardenticatenaceae bacterium]
MKIGILSRNPKLYSTRRLAQAARARGHQTWVVDTLRVVVEIGTPPLPDVGVKVLTGMILQRAQHLPPFDAVIPRIGMSITQQGLAVVRQFEVHGVQTTATSEAIACSRDKLHSLQLMVDAELPVPKTAVISQPEGLFTAIQAVGGLPVVLKATRGTQGQEVLLAHNLTTADQVVTRLRRLGRQVLVQEFIAEAAGKDVRVIVVGGRCVAAMERTATAGDFRANLHRGGTAVSIEPTPDMRALAVRAAQIHGLHVAGVDMLQSERGPLLLEINSSPGLEGIEQATGVDVAGEIVQFLEEKVWERMKRHTHNR